ncbi:MAG: AbrB/MazE/SpoVT family DNA-binding domain-containing protein [Alphaproteobacteria bacterium]|nr:AbrB/MazE/SpoVT family DNA-binding domain-containing protein [Alphaproteobacteria bacterium]
MKIDIISIGNSKGIRLPKLLLEQYGLTDCAELETTEDAIILRQPRIAREGWDEALKKLSPKRKKAMLDDESFDTSFDRNDWEW